jgi:hypothetical protein
MFFRLRLPIPRFALPLVGLFLAAGSAAVAADAPVALAPSDPPAHLDQKAVHDEYMNGNFETVVARIEDFRKRNPEHTREDSLFIARHLGVVLSADPRTAQAGKYWMHRLLQISPDAELTGMYASETIERTFAKMKKAEGAGPGGRGGRKWLWIGAGGAAVTAGIIAWIVFSPTEETPERATVPVDL